MSDPVLEPLNEQQKKAVLHEEGPLLILAGAGSGKTRAITHRMAYLIRDRGIPPYRILGVTFTNKAADEMTERTRELVGEHNLNPEISTFHSFGVEFLRNEISALNRDRNFSIYDSGDQKTLIKQCMSELGISSDHLKPKKVLNKISRAKDQLVTPDEYLTENEHGEERIQSIYAEYQKKLVDNNAYDFGDLISEPVFLMRQNDTVRERWTTGSRSFTHMMIDEFQDTNPAQYELAEILSEAYRNITVVGDDDQSIYSWRGADVTNILNFESDFPEAETIRLEQNYRSTQPILEAAHEIIKNNPSRKGKELWTQKEKGREPTVYEAENDYDEAEYVVETIRTLEKMMGISPGDCAIFFRTNAQTRVFEEVFMRESMPYMIISGVGFYERKEIKDLMAYLKILVNPSDDQSLRRIINTPSRGIGAKTLEALETVAERENTSLLQALSQLDEQESVSGRARSSLESFRDIYDSLRECLDSTPIEVLERVLDETNYIEQEVETEDDETAESRKENIDELKRVAETFAEERPDPSLQTFVEEITLMSDVDTFESDEDRVKIMTLHAAKGLEFPVVFMAGMEEGLLPHNNSQYDPEKREEERRLCYVGFTRAQERLYTSWCRRRWMYGSERTNKPSRFLTEAGLIDDEKKSDDPFKTESSPANTQPEPTTTSTSTPRASNQSESNDQESDFSVGDHVKHRKFGEGEIVELREGSSPVAKIKFQTGDIKRLAVSYARLERIG